jgi:hypothetical protein
MPPRGEKVFRRTRVVMGMRAKVFGYVQLFSATPLLVLAMWGSGQASPMARRLTPGPAACAATFSTPPLWAVVWDGALKPGN